MISSMDDGVGRILSKLKEEEIFDNTLFSFFPTMELQRKDGLKKKWS